MKTKSTDERMSSKEAVSGSFTGLNPVCRLSETTRKLATVNSGLILSDFNGIEVSLL